MTLTDRCSSKLRSFPSSRNLISLWKILPTKPHYWITYKKSVKEIRSLEQFRCCCCYCFVLCLNQKINWNPESTSMPHPIPWGLGKPTCFIWTCISHSLLKSEPPFLKKRPQLFFPLTNVSELGSFYATWKTEPPDISPQTGITYIRHTCTAWTQISTTFQDECSTSLPNCSRKAVVN